MSSMDINTSDEKENTSAMSSLETDASADQPTAVEAIGSTPIKEKVKDVQEDALSLPPNTDKSCDECQGKGVECTHVGEAKTVPRRGYVLDSDDDSSILSDVPSPVLLRASIPEMSRRKSTDHTAGNDDAMDIDSAESSSQEAPQFPSNLDGEKEDNALPPSRTHSLSRSPSSAKLVVHKEEAAFVAPNPEANKAADNDADSISPSSPGAPLLTPGTGAESLSNRALSPLTTIEAESKPIEPHPEAEPEPEPEPVVELTADEREALMTLSAELSTMPAAVARAAVKEHALKCLVGSKADEITFMDAIFSQASDDVIKSFIDSNATRILEVANKHCKPFLDRALEIHVEDIDGKKLAGYLARAERLGFEEQDEIDGESALPVERSSVQVAGSNPSDNDGDHRMQYMQHPNGEIHGAWKQPPPGYMHNPAYPSPYFVQQGHPPGTKVCHKCGAGFKQNAGLRYHLEKDVCKKAGVPQGPVMARCESCGKEFRSPGGYHYHMTNKVCGALLGRESATPPPGGPAQNEQGATPLGQQYPRKEEESAAGAALPVPSQTSVQAVLPHMFQNAQQQPYQGPYQNPSQQEHNPRPPMPERIVPSMNGTPQPTAASGEQIVNTNGLLTPAQAQKLNEDLRAEDIKYAQQLKNIDPALQGAALDLEVKRLKAGMSTRKSNLRRKHGIFVRKTDKVAANAVRNEDGSIDIAPAGKTISVGAGFAPVNRPEAPAASPAHQRASRGPESPPPGVPDAKRRRVSEHPQQQPMASSPYGQGPMGYPPNYNMHPGSYDPRQPHNMLPGPYQQYSMSPYSQPSSYQQQPPMHPPYGQPHSYQMNTIIRAPGAPVPTQSPSPAMQGPPGPGYFPPSGFVSVNQPPAPTPPPGYMLVASPAPQQHYPVQNGQPHSQPRAASTSASERGGDLRGSSSGPVENGKSRPKVPTDNAEKVWRARQRDWVVQTGPQEAFKRMEKSGKESPEEQDGDVKEKIMKKKEKREKNEFIIPLSDDDDATDEDESARRPSNADADKEKENAEDKIERERRALSTSSELSDLDESALMGVGEGGEPFRIRVASEDSAPKEPLKPTEKKRAEPKPKARPPPPPPTSGFNAINAPASIYQINEIEYDSDGISNARPPVKKPAASRGPPPARRQQNDGSHDEDLEPEHEILQVASEDEMVIDTPPARRRAAAPTASSSIPPSSSAAGTPGSATAAGQPKKRLGRPVGWKKGMGGYRELLDAGVVHHNPEGTPNSRRRAERRAQERALRRQTEGNGDGAESSGPGGSIAAGGRKSIG